MNFLAHLLLTGDEPRPAIGQAWVGAMLPDLVRGPLPPLPEPVAAGARLHRAVDRFTDTHPIPRATNARFVPDHWPFEGVLGDMVYDHCLSRLWRRYHPDPLEAFVGRVHAALARHEHVAPPEARRTLALYRRHGWLGMYASDDGLRHVLSLMEHRFRRRLNRPVSLTPAVDALARDRDAIDAEFTAFFDELIAYSRDHIAQSLDPNHAAASPHHDPPAA